MTVNQELKFSEKRSDLEILNDFNKLDKRWYEIHSWRFMKEKEETFWK